MKRKLLITSTLFLTVALSTLLQGQSYKKAGAIAIGGTGGWDYLSDDPSAHRLYVSHGTQVHVIDTNTNTVTGAITGLNRVHGIAFDHSTGNGFISDGGTGEVVIFELATLKVKSKVKAGTNPDGIVFDNVSKKVFAFNGRSQNATVIDGATGSVTTTISLGGKPEFPVSDGKGSVYDNIEDKSEIVRIDVTTLEVKEHWSVAPCESPSGLALDAASRRLFAVCNNKMMAVVDADSGKVLSTPAIGDGPDAAAFDPKMKLAFSSNGDGTMTIVREVDKNHFTAVGNIPTAKSARTMTIDPDTHKLYFSAADLGPAPESGAGRPAVLPGTFRVLVMQP